MAARNVGSPEEMPARSTQSGAGLTALDITAEEIAGGRIREDHLAAAVAALREDGVVVLDGVVEASHIDVLRRKLIADLGAVLKLKKRPYNFTLGHIQQDPPPFHPYLFRDVLLNDAVVAVTKAVLGPGLGLGAYTGHINLPGSPRQPVHTDWGQLWPNLETAHPAYALIIDVPLVDVSRLNGSTELWPGTHLDTTMSISEDNKRVPREAVAQRRKVARPVQPRIRRGGVLIRDIRLWHRGMPNRTGSPRPMITMMHFRKGFGISWPMPFPKEAEAFFAGGELRANADFVAGPVNYLERNEPYDFRA